MVCSKCKKEFKSKAGLASHIKTCQVEPTEREVYLKNLIDNSINQVAVQNAKIELGIK